jgi:hypothetical protein
MSKKKISRMETGPIKFGGDWTGLFVRGDSAMYYAFQASQMLEDPDVPPHYAMFLSSLKHLFETAAEGSRYDLQECLTASECCTNQAHLIALQDQANAEIIADLEKRRKEVEKKEGDS